MFINETFFYKKLFLTFSNLHLKITGTGHKNVSMSLKILSANLVFELSLIFCMLILNLLKHFQLGVVKMGVAILVTGLSNWLYLSQEGIDWINWFFKRCYKFRKTWSCFNNSWMGMVKNEHGYSCYGTLLLAVSQKWIDEMSWSFACW